MGKLANAMPVGTNKMSATRAILLAAAASILLLAPGRALAQGVAGPLPPAKPSDEAAPAPRATAPALIGGKPNLSGTWVLNKDLSDDPSEKLRDARGSAAADNRIHPSVGGMGGPWGGGMGGGTRGGGPRMGGGSQGDNPDTEARDMLDELSQITVEQDPTSAKVTDASGQILAMYSNASSATAAANPPGASSASSAGTTGGTSTATATGGAANSTSNTGTAGSSTAPVNASSSASNSTSSSSSSASPGAKWQDTQLIAVTKERESKITRTFEISSDGRLDVTTKIDNPRFKRPALIEFIYDPAPAGE